MYNSLMGLWPLNWDVICFMVSISSSGPLILGLGAKNLSLTRKSNYIPSILPKLSPRARFLVPFEVSSNLNKLLLLQERSTTTSSKQ